MKMRIVINKRQLKRIRSYFYFLSRITVLVTPNRPLFSCYAFFLGGGKFLAKPSMHTRDQIDRASSYLIIKKKTLTLNYELHAPNSLKSPTRDMFRTKET